MGRHCRSSSPFRPLRAKAGWGAHAIDRRQRTTTSRRNASTNSSDRPRVAGTSNRCRHWIWLVRAIASTRPSTISRRNFFNGSASRASSTPCSPLVGCTRGHLLVEQRRMRIFGPWITRRVLGNVSGLRIDLPDIALEIGCEPDVALFAQFQPMGAGSRRLCVELLAVASGPIRSSWVENRNDPSRRRTRS
jgi:hypothetical protein